MSSSNGNPSETPNELPSSSLPFPWQLPPFGLPPGYMLHCPAPFVAVPVALTVQEPPGLERHGHPMAPPPGLERMEIPISPSSHPMAPPPGLEGMGIPIGQYQQVMIPAPQPVLLPPPVYFGPTGRVMIDGEVFDMCATNSNILQSQLLLKLKKLDEKIAKAQFQLDVAHQNRIEVLYCLSQLDQKTLTFEQDLLGAQDGPRREEVPQQVEEHAQSATEVLQDENVQQQAEPAVQSIESVALPEQVVVQQAEITQQIVDDTNLVGEHILIEMDAQKVNVVPITGQRALGEVADVVVNTPQRVNLPETFSNVVGSSRRGTNQLGASSVSGSRKPVVAKSRGPSTNYQGRPRGRGASRRAETQGLSRQGARQAVVDEEGFTLVGKATGQPISSPAVTKASISEPSTSAAAFKAFEPEQAELTAESFWPQRESVKRKSSSDDEDVAAENLATKFKKPVPKKTKKSKKGAKPQSATQVKDDDDFLDECLLMNSAENQKRGDLLKKLNKYCDDEAKLRKAFTGAPTHRLTDTVEKESHKLLEQFLYENRKTNWESKRSLVEQVLRNRLNAAEKAQQQAEMAASKASKSGTKAAETAQSEANKAKEFEELALKLSVLLTNINTVVVQDVVFFQNVFEKKGGFGEGQEIYLGIVFGDQVAEAEQMGSLETTQTAVAVAPQNLPEFSVEALTERLERFGTDVLENAMRFEEGRKQVEFLRESSENVSMFWYLQLAIFNRPDGIFNENQLTLIGRFSHILAKSKNEGIRYLAYNMKRSSEVVPTPVSDIIDLLYNAFGFNPHQHK